MEVWRDTLQTSWQWGGALCTPALRMAGEYEYVLGDTLQTSWQWDCVPLRSRFEDGGEVQIRGRGTPPDPWQWAAPSALPLHRRTIALLL